MGDHNCSEGIVCWIFLQKLFEIHLVCLNQDYKKVNKQRNNNEAY